MRKGPALIYTAWAGIFLLIQGIATLAFRLHPPLDRAFPPLLALTQMRPWHSLLHIATGTLALLVLYRGGRRGCISFAAGFGCFYAGLAVYCWLSHHATPFELQPFDHPFHFVLGLAGLCCAAAEFSGFRKGQVA